MPKEIKYEMTFDRYNFLPITIRKELGEYPEVIYSYPENIIDDLEKRVIKLKKTLCLLNK